MILSPTKSIKPKRNKTVPGIGNEEDDVSGVAIVIFQC